MNQGRSRPVTSCRVACGAVLALVGCGDRTELVVPVPAGGAPHDGGRGIVELGDYGAADARVSMPGFDASLEARSDATSGIDAGEASEAGAPTRCGDGGPLPVAYVLDAVGNLYRYYPDSGDEVLLGTPSCGDSSVPWTMTAGRDHAYIVYTDWTIFRVDLGTLDCSPTAFVAGQLGLEDEFGVALTGSGASERLYYYGVPAGSSTAILAASDTESFALSMIGTVDPGSPNDPLFPVNLAADNEGHLFAYAPEPEGDLIEIDPASGAVSLTVDEALPSGPPYATLAYRGSVYLFADTVVEQFEPPAPGAFSTRTIGAGAIGAGSYSVCP